MIDIELQKYYENQLDLFASPGFKALIEQAQQIKNIASDINRANNEQQLFFAKGQLDILNWLLNWEQLVREAIKQNESDV